MAKIKANMDCFNPLWEDNELKSFLENGQNAAAIKWMMEKCPCNTDADADDVELLCDGTIMEHDGYKLLYSDYGFIERLDLIK